MMLLLLPSLPAVVEEEAAGAAVAAMVSLATMDLELVTTVAKKGISLAIVPTRKPRERHEMQL